MSPHPSSLPLAYKTGHKNFYGRDFIVTSDVLIPRPETEQLIDLALELFGKTSLPGVRPPAPVLSESGADILDVGTGSGCIALTLALELPSTNLLATDISKPALVIAEKNAKNLGVKNITFLHSDLCFFGISSAGKISRRPNSRKQSFVEGGNAEISLLPEESSEKIPATFDLIAANLPYVDPAWPWLDRESLSFEPNLALYAENKGLALIFKLITQVSNYHLLTPSGFLILEADPCQHDQIAAFASSCGFTLEKTLGFQLLLKYTKK